MWLKRDINPLSDFVCVCVCVCVVTMPCRVRRAAIEEKKERNEKKPKKKNWV